jgi:hypothetical protein
MTAILSPLTIVALAPLCPTPESGVSPTLVEADPADPDGLFAELGPRLRVEMPQDLCPAGEVVVDIRSMRDFAPHGLSRCVGYLEQLAQAGAYAVQAASAGGRVAATVEDMRRRWPGLPLDYPEETASSGTSATERPEPGNSRVDDILSMVAVDGSEGNGAATRDLNDLARQAERLARAVTSRILADPGFRRCEASWQGVRLLLRQGLGKAENVRLLLGSVSHENLKESLDALLPRLAADLPGLLLVDLEFDNTPHRVEQLGQVVEFGASLLCPTLVWAGPGLFGVHDWDAFSKLAYLRHHMEDAAFAKLRSLAKSPEAAWLGVAVNRMALRSRHVDLDERDVLWTSPVWALGTLVAMSMQGCNWPTRFTEYGRFTLADLAAGSEGAGDSACEISVGEDRMAQLLECGLLPLVGPLGKDTAFMPREVALDGGSLRHQLLFSRVIGVLLRLQQETEGLSAAISDPADLVRKVLASLFSETGHAVPDDLTVVAVGRDASEDGAAEEVELSLDIAFTPPTTVLANGRMGFRFLW